VTSLAPGCLQEVSTGEAGRAVLPNKLVSDGLSTYCKECTQANQRPLPTGEKMRYHVPQPTKDEKLCRCAAACPCVSFTRRWAIKTLRCCTQLVRHFWTETKQPRQSQANAPPPNGNALTRASALQAMRRDKAGGHVLSGVHAYHAKAVPC